MSADPNHKSKIENRKSKIALAVIPARFGSTRFPGKPLADDTGKPLIQHVVENARRARLVDRVVVATDDQRIFDAVQNFGGQVVMTGEHDNGTSRIAEAILKLESCGLSPEQQNTSLKPQASSLIVNVQGDEPEIDPAVIDKLIAALADDPDADMATLLSPFGPDEDPADPNLVKVVRDTRNRAIYFSRSVIPYTRDPRPQTPDPIYKHPGLYAYRRAFLLKYPALSPTPLEQAEKLEQLRVLEHGHRIALIEADAPHPGIDTPQQYAAFVERYRRSHA